MNHPTNNVPVVLKPEDFGEWDSSDVYEAGAALLGEVADIAFHCTNPGEGWTPYAEGQGAAALIAEVRGHVERLETATRAARRELARIESTARLAALRRMKAEGAR